jgi:hypothetical protein
MKKFDLIELSEKLLQADEELASAQIAYVPLEKEYTSRKNHLLVQNMGLSSQPLREAETMEALKQEEIYDTYHEALLKIKLASSRYNTIKEICSNIRSSEYANARSL